jgi:hypothetical protein
VESLYVKKVEVQPFICESMTSITNLAAFIASRRRAYDRAPAREPVKIGLIWKCGANRRRGSVIELARDQISISGSQPRRQVKKWRSATRKRTSEHARGLRRREAAGEWLASSGSPLRIPTDLGCAALSGTGQGYGRDITTRPEGERYGPAFISRSENRLRDLDGVRRRAH